MSKEIFDTVEELTGTAPSAINLRSGIHAVITADLIVQSPRNPRGYYRGALFIMKQVESLAKEYEGIAAIRRRVNDGTWLEAPVS